MPLGPASAHFTKWRPSWLLAHAELTAACTKQKVPLPDLDGFFFPVQQSGAEADDKAGEHDEDS